MTSIGAPTPKSELECCMCGDSGFSDELFHCKICQSRSQHRYCSNLYPKADCYRVCNWCLTQKEESKPKSPNSSNSSSSNKAINARDDYSSIKNTRIKDRIRSHEMIRPIKKQRSPDASQLLPPPPPPPPRKPLAVEDNLRRTRSEEISQRSGIQRQVVFRNRVRRYKLLDEVSS